MKRFIVLLILILLNINIVFAEKNDKNYSIHFNGSKFYLLYSVKNKDFGGYLNEYYKKGDTYNIWSELVAVHHFPNAYSPIDRIKEFKDYLGSMHVPSSLTFDDKKNTAMIDFIMISEHSMPIVIEFNIFKYEKSKKCGSVAIQYTRRYSATTTMQIEAIKKDIEKNRKPLIAKVKNFEIPEIVSKDIDKCISAADLIEENKNKPSEEVAATDVNTEADTEETTLQETNADKDAQTEIAKEDLTESVAAPKAAENNKEIAEVSETTAPAEETASKEGKTKDVSDTKEQITEDKAPVPVVQADNKQQKKSSKKKKNKNDNYEIVNDKNDFIATPRTKDDLKNEIKEKKQRQKDMAKQAKLQAKADKKAQKVEAKNAKKQAKNAKKQAKRAEKEAKKPYTVSNSNTDLIATPRTKKELKEHNKQLRKQAKERAKKAKKNLE